MVNDMERRAHIQNIPIEIMRTIVAVSQSGSLSKAAALVGLSQAAVSAQMKRIETIVGGALFSKTPNGSILTDLGNMVLVQAHKILAANDQVLSLGGSSGPEIVRLGLSAPLVRRFMLDQDPKDLASLRVQSDTSAVIGRAVIEGHVDVACFFECADLALDLKPFISNQYEDNLVWVRSTEFALAPGTPIPIVTGAGGPSPVRALVEKGLPYKVVFNGEDYDAKISAVEAGLGLSTLPRKLVPPSLVEAKEYYLPDLPNVKTILCTREGLRSPKANAIHARLISLFFSNNAFAGSDWAERGAATGT
jgi:DNA-binding transcriptional LysR family regulator